VFLPACLLAALGIIFFFNILTNDWDAWAYAWLLLPAGLGAGLALAGRADDSRPLAKAFFTTGLALAATSLALFVLFGAIAGGLFIQIIAPFLLIAGGVSLRWLPLDRILPGTLRQRLRISDASPKGAPTEVGTSISVESPTSTTPPLLAEKPAVSLAEPLSPRELEVLRLVGEGLSNQEIAARLNVAASTVKTHINNIFGKLGVETRVQAINRAREAGLLDP
jgi:DNA-binding CsgD family transcriptional regulator